MNDQWQPAFANGKICYVEIPAIDILQSAKFYQTVFGWKVRNDNSGSIAFDDTTGQVSGMWVLDREPMAKPGVLISIMVDSVADTLKLILINGGSIAKQPDYNASEIIAWFADPAGNIFSLYQQ